MCSLSLINPASGGGESRRERSVRRAAPGFYRARGGGWGRGGESGGRDRSAAPPRVFTSARCGGGESGGRDRSARRPGFLPSARGGAGEGGESVSDLAGAHPSSQINLLQGQPQPRVSHRAVNKGLENPLFFILTNTARLARPPQPQARALVMTNGS